MGKPFFHELSDDAYKALEDGGATWGDIMERFDQPEWCDYPNALEGVMGCWSLIYRKVKDESRCLNCDMRRQPYKVPREGVTNA